MFARALFESVGKEKNKHRANIFRVKHPVEASIAFLKNNHCFLGVLPIRRVGSRELFKKSGFPWVNERASNPLFDAEF